jgi:tetratricopeptide (TPR) repeat protein
VLQRNPSDAKALEFKAYYESTQRRVENKVRLAKPDFGASLKDGGAPGDAGLTGAAGPGGRSTWSGGPSGSGAAKPAALDPAAAALGGPPSPAQPLIASAWRKYGLRDYSGSLLDATRAIQADSRNARAYSFRAFLSNRIGELKTSPEERLAQFQAALGDADAALALDPGNVQGLLERGYAQIQLGNYQLAMGDIRKALELNPKVGLGYYYLALALEKVDQPQEALRNLELAVRYDPALKPLCDEMRSRISGNKAGRQGRPSPWRLLGWLMAAWPSARSCSCIGRSWASPSSAMTSTSNGPCPVTAACPSVWCCATFSPAACCRISSGPSALRSSSCSTRPSAWTRLRCGPRYSASPSAAPISSAGSPRSCHPTPRSAASRAGSTPFLGSIGAARP